MSETVSYETERGKSLVENVYLFGSESLRNPLNVFLCVIYSLDPILGSSMYGLRSLDMVDLC